MLTQSTWRKAGGVAIVLAIIMAVVGTNLKPPEYSVALIVVFWSFFSVLLLTALFMAWLDFRYIRLQYKVGKREVFKDTLGDESFRKAIREALEDEAAENKPDRNN